MKLLHMADLHLGSPLTDLPDDKRAIRAAEISSSLKRAVDYAKINGIRVIILAGDVFDSDRPRRSDREFFYGIIEANPDIDFLYLRGNHDTEESYSRSDIKNLKTFGREWKTYVYGDTAISGAELPSPCPPSFYSALSLSREKFNVVVLHGQITPSRTSVAGEISLPLLKDKNVDYLALGHFHAYTAGALDGRGAYVYSGCPEGRGFDEAGDKGFVEVDTSARRFTFVKAAVRDIAVREIDISGAVDAGDVIKRITSSLSGIESKSIVRAALCGSTQIDIPAMLPRIKNYFAANYFSFDVKNKTKPSFPDRDYSLSASLKGEFYRSVKGDENLTEDERTEILLLGMRALNGEEV